MMPEILEVTNGTDIVSFLNEGSGFVLDGWEPRKAQKKEGGVYKDSGIADGRTLAMKRYENVEESFVLKVTGCSANVLYANLRKLRKLLDEAESYWLTGFAYEPVWLVAKGRDEAYPRYCIIASWHYDAESDPFHPPVGGNSSLSVMNDFELLIERKPFWSDAIPGAEDAIEAGVSQTYDGRTLGNVDGTGTLDPTTAAEVFFSNKHIFTNLTDIYEDDGGAFSANLLDAALPHRLLPAVPAVGDAIYFGIDNASAAPGPFSSLICDIQTAVAGVTGVWEYWNGAWVAFGANVLADNTVGFSLTGVLGIFWDHPADWATNAVNAITGWWVRFRVTVAAGATGGDQQNRDIYSVTWPYIEVQDDQVESELPALLKERIRNESNYDDDIAYEKYVEWLMCGMRGVDRGSNFTAYLPLADVQVLPGETIALGGNAAYIDDVLHSARGRCIELAPGAPGVAGVFTVTLDNTIANEYKGRFHMFLRYRLFGATWDIYVRTRAFGNIWTSDTVGIPVTGAGLGILDMGSINLPPAGFGNNETVEEIEFQVWGTLRVGAVDLQLYELILMPADEWLGQFYGHSNDDADWGPRLSGTNYLDIDSVTFPKKVAYAPVRTRAANNLESQWTNSNVGPARIESERRSRLWFLTSNAGSAPGVKLQWANHSYSNTIQLSIARQYFSSIGRSL